MDANLNGKTIFVGGGAGNIGAMAVRGCLRAGATVITASRETDRLERLRHFIQQDGLDAARLITLEGSLGDEAAAQALSQAVSAQAGPPDGVITSLGGGMKQEAKLLDMPLQAWEDVLRSNLTSHLIAARAFLPDMIARGGGSLTLVSGYGGLIAWPGSAPISVAAAGVIALARNLATENRGSGVRIRTMMLATDETLWPQFEHVPGSYQADDVGDFLAWLASEAGSQAEPDVINFITPWRKANALRFMQADR